jgi:hypothetical protein
VSVSGFGILDFGFKRIEQGQESSHFGFWNLDFGLKRYRTCQKLKTDTNYR